MVVFNPRTVTAGVGVLAVLEPWQAMGYYHCILQSIVPQRYLGRSIETISGLGQA